MMQIYRMEGRRISDEAAFWEEYLRIIKPDGAEYFGRSISAFRDAVTGGGPGWPGEHCKLQIIGHAAAGVEKSFFDLLKQIAAEGSGFEIELI